MGKIQKTTKMDNFKNIHTQIYIYMCVCLFFVYIFFARVKSHFLGCQENMWTCENNTKARASHSDMLDEGTCRFTDVEAFIDPDKFQGVAP